MLALKPYQLVQVTRRIDGTEFQWVGQTMSFPTPGETIMVRKVPGHPGTLEELKTEQVQVLLSQTRRRWVHYAVVKPHKELGPLADLLTSFPMDMLRRERAVAVTFDPETNTRQEEQYLIAKVGEVKKPNWNTERWKSFGWELKEVRSERVEATQL